ncbi:MAG TPA: hypothetical protein IGS37_08295 [Synechococcales cyanobacterium M55_K2018_004]|nr:hypothetical protein [Synechococcales cyanobacterium M55_K2018_004]
MNWYSQLTHLIMDFYREDPTELGALQPLQACKLSRRWGVLRVECPDRQTADRLAQVGDLLREPVAEMRLSQYINILVRGTLVASLPVHVPKLKT